MGRVKCINHGHLRIKESNAKIAPARFSIRNTRVELSRDAVEYFQELVQKEKFYFDTTCTLYSFQFD